MSPGSETDPGLAADAGERYERVERIATGGMGEVWRARDTVLDREVAVKILKRELADDPTFRARFAAEAKHAAGLHHPGIASVFDYGLLSEGMPYLVMELVDGKPLSDLLAGARGVDPEQARMLALQTAEALAVAHAAGVIHRDIKPANMLVTPDGRVKITDFGIARAVDSVAFTQTGQIVGTPQYLSPEQARGNAATAASDVYALGIVLFECLAGHRPFTADTPIATALAQIQQDVPALPEAVPAPLAEVVMRALAKDPRERYADGAELAAALRAAGGEGPPVPPPTLAPTAPLAESTRVHPASQGPDQGPGQDADPASGDPDLDLDPDPDQPADERRSRWPLYAGGLLALAVLVALLVVRPWEGTNPAEESDTVSVRRADYIGRPVDEAVAALEDKGLETVTETRENPGDRDTDTVADLNPTGQVDAGSAITLQVWGDRPAAEPTEDEPAPEPDPPPTQDNDQDDPGNTEAPGDEGTEETPQDPTDQGTPEDQGNEGEPTDPGNEPAPDDDSGPGNGNGNGNGAGGGNSSGPGNGNGNGGDPQGQSVERGNAIPGAGAPDTAGSPGAAVPTQAGGPGQAGGSTPGKSGD